MRWLAVALFAPVVAFAQKSALPDSVLEVRTAEVSSTLRCPVCRGESIQDSPADLAKEMRMLVHDMLREGKTPDEIRAYFVGRYGEWILLQPRMSGLNILLYLLPVVAIVGGGMYVVRFAKRSAGSTENDPV